MRRTYPRDHVHHKSRGTTYTTNSSSLDLISSLVSIACASSRIEILRIPQSSGFKELRPQLHLILRSGPGLFKSTILKAVGEQYGVAPYSNVTFPGMIGTVDQSTGKIIPGLVWQARKKPLLLDEFKTGERGDSAAVDVLLGTMESGYYKRKIGLRSESYHDPDGSLFYRMENGEIEVQTRFAAIIATMKNWDMSRSGKYTALTQRCIPIRYSLDDATIDAVLDGTQIPYRHRKYDPPQHARITLKEYRKIRDVAADVRDRNRNFKDVYARAIGDVCRILAVTGRLDLELFRLVCNLKAGLPLENALQLCGES